MKITPKKVLVLNEQERRELFRDDGATVSGGFQGFVRKLRNQTMIPHFSTDAVILLDDSDLERIPRYAFKYSNGGWQGRLKAIFSRGLGDDLGRTA